jgi:hypothetical protein
MSAPGAEERPFIVVTEVADGAEFAEPIFQKKYRAAAPRHGRHLLAFYRGNEERWIAVAYLNYLPFRAAMLIGGACTDGEILRTLPEAPRRWIEANGGLMLQLVRYGEARFAAESIGTFGHCGDARSWAVLSQCGYCRLDHPYLIVRWNREPQGAARAELLAAVEAQGPF